jgi:hypothetical protein
MRQGLLFLVLLMFLGLAAFPTACKKSYSLDPLGALATPTPTVTRTPTTTPTSTPVCGLYQSHTGVNTCYTNTLELITSTSDWDDLFVRMDCTPVVTPTVDWSTNRLLSFPSFNPSSSVSGAFIMMGNVCDTGTALSCRLGTANLPPGGSMPQPGQRFFSIPVSPDQVVVNYSDGSVTQTYVLSSSTKSVTIP